MRVMLDHSYEMEIVCIHHKSMYHCSYALDFYKNKFVGKRSTMCLLQDSFDLRCDFFLMFLPCNQW
jgi:hypothetical protein